VNAASRKSTLSNTRNRFKEEICKNISFLEALILQESKNYGGSIILLFEIRVTSCENQK